MWQWYFGAGFHYYGVDINEKTQQFANEFSKIFIGDQVHART